MLKRFVALSVCITIALTSGSLSAKAYAATSDPIEPEATSMNDPVELSYEDIMVDGIMYRFTLFDDNGILVETVSELNDTQTDAQKNALPKQNIDALLELAESRAKLRANPFAIDSSSTAVEYHNSAASSSNDYCFAGHWGFVDLVWSMSPFKFKLYDTAVRGVYMGGGNPYGIQLTHTIDWTGLSLGAGWSFPGFSISPSIVSGAATRTMGLYTGNFLATAETEGGEITNLFSTFWVGTTCVADIFVTSSYSHEARVHDSWSVYEFIW